MPVLPASMGDFIQSLYSGSQLHAIPFLSSRPEPNASDFGPLTQAQRTDVVVVREVSHLNATVTQGS